MEGELEALVVYGDGFDFLGEEIFEAPRLLLGCYFWVLGSVAGSPSPDVSAHGCISQGKMNKEVSSRGVEALGMRMVWPAVV